MQFAGSHILSVQQFERADVERIFAVADCMGPYARRRRVTRVLDEWVDAPARATEVELFKMFGHVDESNTTYFSAGSQRTP